MNASMSKDRWILVVTVLVLLLPLFAGVAYIYQKHHWATARLAELEPRYARLLGIEHAKTELDKANSAANAILSTYLYPMETELNQAGNEMQQRVRDILSSGGLRVGSSQVFPPKTDALGFDRIQLTIKAEGDLLALQAALLGLQDIRPVVFVDSLTVNVMGTPRAEMPQNLSIQIELSAWRAHP